MVQIAPSGVKRRKPQLPTAAAAPSLSPLSSALTTHSFALCQAALLALGDKEAFLFDRAQNAVARDFFAKAFEQVFGRLAIS
jgi:hypothetical protein